MIRINSHLFHESASLRVRQVELRADDDVRRHYEKLARIVLDEMYQFVGLLDTEGTLLEVNRAALEGGGIRLDEIQGKPFWEAHWWTVSRVTQEDLRRSIARAAQGEFVRYDVEVFGGAAGSETIVIDFSLVPVKDTSGRVVFLLAEGRNITEKKQAEAEIARKNQELEQLLARIRELDELKSQFFANVSHELRTPLALILGPADKVLSQGENLTPLQRRDVEVIRRNASMLLKHVNDLLDLAKLDAGQMVPAYTEVDLAHRVRLTAGHFDALAPERGISFVVDTPERLDAQVDPEKVERVLLNLLSNAFKFTPDGGRVKCELRSVEPGLALLSVQDTGPGVRPELRGSIFERFRQGDGGSDRQFGGTGLGLAIAKDFVELHGGTIGVTDAPGGGALFLVEIPTRAPEGATVRKGDAAAAGPSAVEGALEELRPLAAAPRLTSDADLPLVLVVEDNPELNRFVAESLSADHRVATAFDGEEGLQRALELRPDLIVTDVMMPRMSGDRMIAEIRRYGELEGVPILVLSAKADDALRVRLLREGAQDYVTKPFSAEELRARAGNLVVVKRTRDLLRRELMSHGDDLEALVAELVQRRREAEAARAQAEAASHAKTEFLATMSHELRTPLNAIIGYVDLIDAELAGPVTPTQRSYLDRVRASSRHLVSLIGDVLDMGKIEAGRVQLHPRAVRADEAVDAALALVRPQAEANRLHLTSACVPGGDVVLHADPERLRQILVNVTGNAVKFTEPGGRITVTCGRVDELAYGAAPEGSGPWAVIRVQDTGIGIPADRMESIWRPFEQVDSGRTRAREGAGLGLAISRSLARLMGGDLVAHSEPGAGSTFVLLLPAAETDSARVPERRGRERHAEGISVVGDAVLAEVERIVHGYLARLRTDPEVPSAWRMSEAGLEDHAATLLVDIAGALNAVEEAAGAPSQVVRDAQEIQRMIAERHGQSRARSGWSPAELSRDYRILREELERAVRRRAERGTAGTGEVDSTAVEQGLALFTLFIERAEQTSLAILETG
jgi:PAS domain S-box-containing protein